MDKQKKQFVNDLLAFVNQDVENLSDVQCRKLAVSMQEKAIIPYDALLPIREYSGGVLTNHFDIEATDACRKFLKTLYFRLNLLLNAVLRGEDTEDFGERRINFTLNMSGKFRLAVTPDMTGPDADVYMLLVGFAWALHGLPVDRFKKCQWCANIFLQTTGHHKECCSKKCADRRVDAKRRGTPERKEIMKRASKTQHKKNLTEKLGLQKLKIKNKKSHDSTMQAMFK